CRPQEAPLDLRGPALVLLAAQLQDVPAFARDGRRLLRVAFLPGKPTLASGQQRDCLQEVRALHPTQDLVLVEPLPPFLPVVPQVELGCGERGGEQLEDIEDDSSGVYLFEDRADRFSGGLLA